MMAQEKQQPPHDGHLKRVGYYNMEVVDCSGYLEIYMYELDMYPIRNHGLSGFVDFHFPDTTCSTSRLHPYGIDGFTAEPERDAYSSCEIFVRLRGVTVSAVFSDLACLRPED